MPPDVTASKPCLLCKKACTEASLCSRCKSTHYCSQECQTKDWPVHKLLCKSFSEFDLSTRPSECHFRGILFPEHQSKPQIVWLESPSNKVDGYTWNFPNLKPFLGDVLPERIMMQTDPVLKRPLPNTIHICCRSNFEGSCLNQSVATALAAPELATIPGQPFRWCGPVVAVSKQGRRYDPDSAPCRDLDMNDFRYIVDYLVAYSRLPHC
ncbi:hypothetical protein G7054_g14423 [Neopestalotiopsis clavispora]|nr:hypothetical protein G7054_g14423 [Neopestalotiopsis clavispora]